MLWPEQPPKAAHHSLNEALRILRRAGSAALVTSVGDQVRLADKGIELDVERFDRLSSERNWAEAATVMAGTFLEGFGVPGASGVEDWLRIERESWAQKGVRALAHHVAALIDAARHEEAIQHARRAVALDPVSETAARCLMRALALAGLRTEALQAYESLAERLAAALGTKPGEETRALADRVRHGRAWRSAATPVEHPVRRAPLVGREKELERLLKSWRTCHESGRAAVAFVLGDPGTGKTRLADELLERARLDGAVTATARAVAPDESEPWSGLLALASGGLLDMPGVAGAPADALGTLGAQLPAWAERFPQAPRSSGRLTKAFTAIARAVCAEQPLVLLVDDAQWLDEDTLNALSGLVRDLARHPFLLVLTATEHPTPPRPELDELRARLRRDVPGVALRLGPLSRDDLLALGRWALPDYDAVALDRVTRRVATDSACLPLLAVELLDGVAAGLELQQSASAWPEPLRTLDQTMPGDFPDAVVGAIRVNFHRVSSDGRAVLAALAVLGGRVAAARLSRATGLTTDGVTTALDELEWLRWVTADARGYSFVARVVGEVVARDMVTAGQRERITRAAPA